MHEKDNLPHTNRATPSCARFANWLCSAPSRADSYFFPDKDNYINAKTIAYSDEKADPNSNTYRVGNRFADAERNGHA